MLNSYLFYVTIVLSSTVFAGLAQKFSKHNKKGKRVPNIFFMGLSLITLIFVMGFRDISIGVDGLSYLEIYYFANSVGVLEFYQTRVTEPGFYLLNRISYILGDEQWLLILSSIITIFLFYKALSYEIDKINLSLVVFVFSTTQYFYYFGIMRMGIAVSIIAFAYRYIIEGHKKKFILFVFLATMFHYSALFALVLLFLGKDNQNFFKRVNLLKLMFLIPIGFLTVRYLIFPFITASRYQGYIDSSGFIGTSFITSLPLLGLFLLFYNRFSFISKNYQFYFFLFVVKVITEVFSPIIGIGRMVWYANLSICFLFPATIRLNNDKGIKIILTFIIILYCFVYSFYAYFGESFRGQYMLPYKSILFELDS
ncbi:EpsG family protein [Ammoniphilus sp. 3BR4]|uniref:EpsG family protein n=1 Tax=Ammoniphilus sp. 3BR4 TaxID=3158265 RepID=UPI0034674076